MKSIRGQSEGSLADEGQNTGLIAEYTIEPPSYRDLLSDVPGIQLTLEQMVACDPETVSMAFWIENEDTETTENVLREPGLIRHVSRLGEQAGGRTLYQMHLPAAETTYWMWTEIGGVLLGGVGTQDGWTIRMRYPDQDALRAYRNHCKEQGIAFRLRSLKTGASPTENHLTTPQSQLLEAAIKNGYFDVPRGIRVGDLAVQFDISDQAASERLRRALSNALTNDLAF